MDDLKFAIAQINTSVGDIQGNSEKIISCIERAKSSGALMVVFSEMAVPGYPPKDLLLSEDFVRKCAHAQEEIREHSDGIAVIVGGIESVRNKDAVKKLADESSADSKLDVLYNTAFVFYNGKTVYKYHKKHLPNYDVFDEKRYFGSGQEDGVFELLGRKIGLNICEDIWIEDGPADTQARDGAQLILNISSSPFYYSKTQQRQALIKEHIKRGRVPIIYVNQVGGQDDLVFDGESYAFNGLGELVARGKHFEEDFLVFKMSDKPIVQTSHELAEETYDALVHGLKDYVAKNGFEKVVLGLSGGIDSALVAAVAAEALGPQNVMCVLMPSKFSSDHSIIDAEELSDNLGVERTTIPIGPAYDAFVSMLSQTFEGRQFDVAEENIQARIRMIVLYGIANKFGYLVLNTSNKSEAAVGYGTIYGDMAGDYAVIGDVPKTLVYELCRYINRIKGREVIPKHILTKEPSAELRENQKDRDSLPEYSVLDRVIHEYVEEIRSPSQIAADIGLEREILAQIVRKIDRAENKRHRASPQIKITPKAFGTGRRMPIANGYKN